MAGASDYISWWLFKTAVKTTLKITVGALTLASEINKDRKGAASDEAKPSQSNQGVASANASDREFWDGLGENVGPYMCGQGRCLNKRIANSEFCREHHFLSVRGKPYDPNKR